MEVELYQEMYELENSHWWFCARREILLSLITGYISQNSKVLDVGCGTGFVLEGLKAENYDGWGLDISEVAVKFCGQKGLTNVKQGVLNNSTFALDPVGSFDMVTFLDVIEHIDEDLELLITAKEYLKPDGYILITVPAYKFLWSAHDQAHGHKRRYRQQEIRQLCVQAGYDVTFISYFNTFLFPVVAIARLVGRFTKYLTLNFNKVQSGSDAKSSPFIINWLFLKIFGWERYMLPKFSFPFGVSIVCVAQLAECNSNRPYSDRIDHE